MKIKKILIKIGNPIYKSGNRIIKAIGSIKIIKEKYFWAGLGIIFATLFLLGFYQYIVIELPNINEIYNPPKLTTKIYDRNEVLLYQFYRDENRSWTKMAEIPKYLIDATLAVEDKDFYQHRGISVRGILRAIWHNLKTGGKESLRGGSTITQQLIKNVFLTGEKTWKRKIKEAMLSIMIERKLSKDEILERYFNQVAYGGEIYGVGEASLRYFNKEISQISLSEATFLAGLPAAPSSYLPNGQGLALAYERQKQVIDQMEINKMINKETADKLKNEKVEIKNVSQDIKAPHFVFYIKKYLEENLGFYNIERRGLKVITTLDYKTQMMAEKIVAEEIAKVKKLNINNGAALVTDPKNGDILAMVGSKDYFAHDIEGKYNVTTALRQPGSSIKPINYLLALEKGRSLLSIIDDSPVTYSVAGQKPYSPQNYTGKYLGKVTLKTALASSLNVPSVKLLAENGVANMIDLGEKMGISSWQDRSRFGLSLALGSGEVKMVEMAQAYSTFSQLGESTKINPILKIYNYLGETVFEKKVEKKSVTMPKYAFVINEALSDNNARTPIFGPNSKLIIPGKTVAVKTGTTNNLKDNWCIGWTPSIMVLTWVGNNDARPMSWVASGVSGATPIWNRIMTILLKDQKNEIWPVPAEIYKVNYCGREEYSYNGIEKGLNCVLNGSPTPTIGH